MKTLTTPRLRLRQALAEDAHFLNRLMNEQGYLTNVGDRNVRSPGDAATYVATAAIYDYVNGLGFNIVETRSDAVPLGICGLVARGAPGIVEIGYAFLNEVAGQGFATEAATATALHALNELRVTELHGITGETNFRSRRVLERLGMMLIDTSSDGECTYGMRASTR
ncbi:N-acetyltransferase GCN5 [Lysobacter helvus]|uniref:N-acetyltransferase GCN5 n=2 Tax=Lysobacteraceae TaxID=32033 RepID=A0ABM7Q732_9GAMM|nr:MULTISPECIES: GNAT family N-acetyltransferase [Lysobacter]BCT93152.1 N-acetyltransferase GCN5 [Lysobacter caseinilyticus]BCT96304.1 N-acetyltransferase GCN5 [Lysobacter helvus]